MSTTQKQAVYVAVLNVFGEHGISFDDNQKPSALELLSKDMRSEVVQIVTLGIMTNEVDFSDDARAKYDSEEKVKTYVTGMVSNHLRKDLRLNGNEAYQAKNAGSRAGSGDESLKAAKNLKAQMVAQGNKEGIAAVTEFIATREAEIAAEKAKKLAVDVSKLPEALRKFIPDAAKPVETTTEELELDATEA